MRTVETVLDASFIGAAVLCLALLGYLVYRHGVASHYGLLLAGAFLLWGFTCLNLRWKVNVALLLVSLALPLYGTEVVLSLLNPSALDASGEDWIESGWMRLDEGPSYLRRAATRAGQSGRPFDTRTKIQVIRDYRQAGVDAVPSIPSPPLFRQTAVGVMEPRVTLGTIPTVPLGAVSRKFTILCNENGSYATYMSDEHGFNNPAGLWNARPIDVAVLGDSFMEGACVEPENTVAGFIRRRYPYTLNLGRSGNGPLELLAGIREYLTVLRPRVVIWSYFEGNDLADLFGLERQSPLLMRYFDPGFSQGLIRNQEGIDRSLTALVESVEQTIDQGVHQREPVSLRMERIVKLSHLRERIETVSGKSPLLKSPGERYGYLTEAEHVDLFRRILTEAHDAVHAWDGQLLFLYLPDGSRYGAGATASRDRERVLDLVAQLNIPTIDAHRTFEAVAGLVDVFPFRGPDGSGLGHYTTDGYRVIADDIIRYVQNSGILEKPPKQK